MVSPPPTSATAVATRARRCVFFQRSRCRRRAARPGPRTTAGGAPGTGSAFSGPSGASEAAGAAAGPAVEPAADSALRAVTGVSSGAAAGVSSAPVADASPGRAGYGRPEPGVDTGYGAARASAARPGA
ncbi:hypothetical protein EF917_19835 [Streptomyces sp. WAC00469]|nr:hypothetical protein EF917_19835 [Streptomyces sp. WAC00469]